MKSVSIVGVDFGLAEFHQSGFLILIACRCGELLPPKPVMVSEDDCSRPLIREAKVFVRIPNAPFGCDTMTHGTSEASSLTMSCPCGRSYTLTSTQKESFMGQGVKVTATSN